MKLSIIIVNYRSWSFLDRCLSGLGAGLENCSYEIVVVDNHSGDGELEGFMQRFPGVEFVSNGWNGGFAIGCNLGASVARGDTLLFLNPDVIADPDSIEKLVQAKIDNPGVSILSASQVDASGRPQKAFDIFPNRLTWIKLFKGFKRKIDGATRPDPRRAFSGLVDCDWVSGSVLMISRADFDRLGGWSEDYWMYTEDCDLCYRARKERLRVACSGDIQFIHSHGGASRQNFEISVITRTEAIISKHVFNQRHFTGLNRQLNHLIILLASLPRLVLWSIADLLSFRAVPRIRQRTCMMFRLIRYYQHVLQDRHWRSPFLSALEQVN